jgi:endonuclease/exonuclease/phosphatase family metal-dependent hydrolase
VTRAHAQEIQLRVVTYNAWDLPGVATNIRERVARIGPALAALKPDLVSFQELWVDADAERVARDLAAAGLVHTRRFPSGLVGSGLMVASVFPITSASFLRYELGGKPQKPWHGDFYGGKGIARVRLETPLGPLDLADTHLHASYDASGEYELFQVAEALEAADFLAGSDAPLVLGGDLNVGRRSRALGLLEARAGLTRAAPDLGIDWILTRPGRTVSVRCLETKRVLDAPVDLGNGRQAKLSDHDGTLAVLTLAPASAALLSATPVLPREHLEADVLPLVTAAIAASRTRSLAFSAIAVVPLVLAGLVLRARRRRRWLRALAALPLLVASAALLALGLAYEPYERRGLEAARTRLERL